MKTPNFPLGRAAPLHRCSAGVIRHKSRLRFSYVPYTDLRPLTTSTTGLPSITNFTLQIVQTITPLFNWQRHQSRGQTATSWKYDRLGEPGVPDPAHASLSSCPQLQRSSFHGSTALGTIDRMRPTWNLRAPETQTPLVLSLFSLRRGASYVSRVQS